MMICTYRTIISDDNESDNEDYEKLIDAFTCFETDS